ncbi:hypothetical protein GpartN1_g7710.t1 [Galdieria partita]|uniref:Uncharacterized protein n=1 Tax=Galdieria partita TaxID=83374 RepID=A0A9C7Q5E9_9RHOD|nr:hypothetical protein GpartN1_g7710.t1 [Galdieria partita]
MSSQLNSSSHPLGGKVEWRQLLLAVEPNVERGMNLGVYSLKEALREYDEALEKWFLWKKDNLQQLLDSDKNNQLSNIISESLNNSTMDFPEWTLLVQEKLMASTKTVGQLNTQLFIQYDVEFYRKRVFKILKEAFMEVFVTRTERRCRKLFGSFSNRADKKLSKVLKLHRHQVEEKLQELEDLFAQLEHAMKTAQTAQVRDRGSEARGVLIDITGVVELFWRKWRPCWENRETVLYSILDSGLPLVILTELLNRLMLQFPSQGLVWNAQDSLLQYGRLEKLLIFFCQVDPLTNRSLLEWLQGTVYLLCCLSDDQFFQLSTPLEALESHLLQCRENGKFDKSSSQHSTKVEHLLRLFLSLIKKSRSHLSGF